MQSELHPLLSPLLNANPNWALIIDSNVQIVDFNDKVLDSFGSAEELLHSLAGDARKCSIAELANDGRGTSINCKLCQLENIVEEASSKNVVQKCTTRIVIQRAATMLPINVQITATPFLFQDKNYVYVTLEHLSTDTPQKQLIPICSNCLKVRNNDDWRSVELYLSAQPTFNMTHSICPSCRELLYGHKLRLARARAEARKQSH